MKRAPNWTEAEIAKVCEMAAKGISARRIGEEIGRSDDAVWMLKRKVPGLSFTATGGATRPVPADFAEHAYDKIIDLKARYGASHAVICRWREEIGITREMLRDHLAKVSGRKRLQIPEGFFEYQRGRTILEVTQHFGIHEKTASRMFAELGIDRRQEYNARRAAQAAQRKAVKPAPKIAPKPATGVDRSAFIAMGKVDRPHIDSSPAGQAAEYLRRFGPVVRCDERGRYDPAGNRWRRGSSLLTADEIIDRAIRNGWTGGRMAA